MQNELEAKQIGANELSDEDMGNVSGGGIFYNQQKNFEVIDDEAGNVIKTFNNAEAAINYANNQGQSSELYGWSKVKALRQKH